MTSPGFVSYAGLAVSHDVRTRDFSEIAGTIIKSMLGRGLMTVLGILLGLAGLVAPILVDAHHWWPRKAKRKKT